MGNNSLDIQVDNIAREILKNRKNRSILAYSETSKEYNFLYKLVNDYIDSPAEKIDEVLNDLPEEEIIIINDMLSGILNLCREEWKGDESYLNPIEIIIDEDKRIPCSLCDYPKTKEVYYIKNKISKRKMNVGSTCIEEFANISLAEGKTKKQLKQEAEKNSQLKILILEFPGIEKKIETWFDDLNKFDILIPYEFERPYTDLGTRLKNIYNDFIDKKVEKEVFTEIADILMKRDELKGDMLQYSNDNLTKEFVASREIVSWLERNKDVETIEALKETGFVSYATAPKIHEENFLNLIIDKMNLLLLDIGASIHGKDEEAKSFIIKPRIYENLTLICNYNKFISYFCHGLFEEKGHATLNLANLLRVSSIYDRDTLQAIIWELTSKMYNFDINIRTNDYGGFYDYIGQNELDLYDKRDKKVLIAPLKEFVEEFKSLAFGIGDINEVRRFVDYMSNEKKKYTFAQLEDIRTSRFLKD